MQRNEQIRSMPHRQKRHNGIAAFGGENSMRVTSASVRRIRESGTAGLVLSTNARLKLCCAEAQDLAAHYKSLLREGDHRIKNSLQMVLGMMHAQERRAIDPATREALSAASARIQAVASIHDALQLGGGDDAVDLGALVETLCHSLSAMAGESEAAKFAVQTQSIMAPLSIAQPIVLIVNELVLNALRHAFPKSTMGAIFVTLRSVGGELRLVVADDGTGVPPGYSDGRGYGMKLVNAMAEKLGGQLHAQNLDGACFTLSVPADALTAIRNLP
jgi:two-component sensor histidine kinase